MKTDKKIEELVLIVEHQLSSFWQTDIEIINFEKYIRIAYERTVNSFCVSNNKFFESCGFSELNSVHYSLFLYYLSHELGVNADNDYQVELADKIYYLNKIMNSVDWYWRIQLPPHFITEHPVGSVLGRAEYGDYLCLYQGCTIGGSRKNGQLYYPKLSDHLILYANASILGDCHVGEYVILSANTTVINENIPDNVIVFGTSPNLVLKPLSEEKRASVFGISWKQMFWDV